MGATTALACIINGLYTHPSVYRRVAYPLIRRPDDEERDGRHARMHPNPKQHGKGQPGGDTLDDPRTVFVRGLDPAVTDGILSSHFSTIGPVSHAFTVKKRGSSTLNLDHHKGFGFVECAGEGDAVRAVQEMHGTR